jgi:hypothetical protein
MNICDDKRHDEIVYEVNACPLCDFIDDSEDTVARLSDEIKDLESVVSDLEKEIASQSKLFEGGA